MLNKPKQCCSLGSYKCTVPMPIKGRLQGIDFCIADIVAALNAANITTEASCCGHGRMAGDIMLTDGREILVVPNYEMARKIHKYSRRILMKAIRKNKERVSLGTV